MSVLTKDESERLARIERDIQYGVTFKDLSWLVRIVRRLEAKSGSATMNIPFAPSSGSKTNAIAGENRGRGLR